jgi:dihydrofolate synthase/folylpolyglutamate synthase
VFFDTLEAWLHWQSTLHPSGIELGLERVARVWVRLHPGSFPCPVITVAGTNGKGSSVAFLEAILQAAGYRTGSYTSPHLERYNERIRLQGEPVPNRRICRAFEQVERVRGDSSLTYFEFGTLAALEIFAEARPEVVILEVGLGGRLDAVNIIDPDVALITTVDIDHTEWLGEEREPIGREKAGIMRQGRPVVYGGGDPPESLLQTAQELGASLYVAGRSYHWRRIGESWEWRCGEQIRHALPIPHLRGGFQLGNAAAALMVLSLLRLLPVDQQAVRTGLQQARLEGRFQVVPGNPMIILDVAHNPQAARVLAANLGEMPGSGRTLAVFGMLADKAVEAVVDIVSPRIDHWYVAGLQDVRGVSGAALARRLGSTGIDQGRIDVCQGPETAMTAARQAAVAMDRVLVFGSFVIVGAVLRLLRGQHLI